MGVRRGLVWLLCVMLAGLAACSSDGETPEADPTPTASESTSESASADPSPSIPPEAQGTDEKSAKAFVRFYFETLSEAMVTGDTDLLSGLGADKCQTCSALRENIRKTFQNGGGAESEGWRILKFRHLDRNKRHAFDLVVRLGKERFFDASGNTTHRFSGDRRRMVIYLNSEPPVWQVVRLDVVTE